MDAVVVEDSLRVERFPWQIALGQFAPEACGFDQLCRSDMVWVGIEPKRGKDPAWSGQSKQACEFGAVLQVGFQETVRESQVVSSGDS